MTRRTHGAKCVRGFATDNRVDCVQNSADRAHRDVQRPGAEVGIALSLDYSEPANDSRAALEATRLMDAYINKLFLPAIIAGVFKHTFYYAIGTFAVHVYLLLIFFDVI